MFEDENKRSISRQPVLKMAKIHVAQSIYDCRVLDLSETGVRINTEVAVSFLPEVRIEFRSGAIWLSQLRWNRGTEAGFEFLRFDGLNAEASSRASAMLAALQNSGYASLLHRLAEADCFGSPELRAAAEQSERAREAFEQAFERVLHTP